MGGKGESRRDWAKLCCPRRVSTKTFFRVVGDFKRFPGGGGEEEESCEGARFESEVG